MVVTDVASHSGPRSWDYPRCGGFVLGHGAAYITNNSILSDAGQVVKVAI